MKTIKIKDVIPAEYNPRYLSEERFEELKDSLRKLGVIKPILVRAENNVIIAGHQRTKAMLACGIEECPAFIIKNISTQDECRFNQLHNMCEIEVSKRAPLLKVNKKIPLGWSVLQPSDIDVINVGEMGGIVIELNKLYTKYGTFASCVCNEKGEILVSSAYAYMAKLNRIPLDVFCIKNEQSELACHYFGQNYGEFNYDNIERKTYIQTLAQMNRLRDGKKGKGNSKKSSLYRTQVLPYINSQPDPKKIRILDFGAGKYDYALWLKSKGYDITFVDPYHRKEGTNNIDIADNTKRFLDICRNIEINGRFDVVVCDSVLNSVDTMAAHWNVILTVYGLCKPGGVIFISGRPKEDVERLGNMKYSGVSKDANTKFLDQDNFTALFRNGSWFFQKFHDQKQREEIAKTFGDKYVISMKERTAFQIIATKKAIIPKEKVISALRAEFDMMLPNGKSYGLGDRIEKAYLSATEKEISK